MIRTNATPIVVIMGAVPDTPRTGRRQIRSIRTPRPPVSAIVTGKTRSSIPTSGRPVRDADDPVKPNRWSTVRPRNVPVMNTLKWAKLISSMMP